jgi:hypothetical protein
MQRRYITVDVFTDRAFGGNPLAVVLDADGLSTAQMQAIAVEFNYVSRYLRALANDRGAALWFDIRSRKNAICTRCPSAS